MTCWRNGKLGDVLTLQRGFDLPATARREGQIPVVSSSGITGSHDEAKAKAPGVVIGRYGTLGEVHFITSDYWPLNTSLYVKDFKGNDPRYCAYLLKTISVTGTSTAAAVPGVNRNVLHELPVKYPKLVGQRRIASILGAYDDLMEVSRRRIAVLEEMARRLFEERIIRSIGQLPEPGGASHGVTLAEGWRIESLARVAQITMGQSPSSSELNKDGLGFVFHQGVSDFGALFPGRRVFCEQVGGKRIGEEGDILFSVRAPVGRINCATEKTVLGRGLASIRHREGHQAYLLMQLRALFHKTDLIGNGSIYKAVNRADVERIPIIVAPSNLQSKLNAQLSDLLKLVRSLSSAIIRLESSRDLLLPRLISGSLSVSVAERELEAVA